MSASAPRKLYVVRHGERVNMRSAGGNDWYKNTEYQFPPLKLKTRTLTPEDMAWNPPLSTKGKIQADQAGKCLKTLTKGSKRIHVFASPAWRCQQTATGICKQLGTKFKVNISRSTIHLPLPLTLKPSFKVVQGLYEFLQKGNHFGDLAAKKFGAGRSPPWLTASECAQIGLAAIDSGERDGSKQVKAHESLEEYWGRTLSSIEECLASCDGDVIIVAHILSGAISRQMLTEGGVKTCPGEEKMGNLPGAKVRPTCITRLEFDTDGIWSFVGLANDFSFEEKRGANNNAAPSLVLTVEGHSSAVHEVTDY